MANRVPRLVKEPCEILPYVVRHLGLDKEPVYRLADPIPQSLDDPDLQRRILLREASLRRYRLNLPAELRRKPGNLIIVAPSQGGKGDILSELNDICSAMINDSPLGGCVIPRLLTTRPPRSQTERELSLEYSWINDQEATSYLHKHWQAILKNRQTQLVFAHHYSLRWYILTRQELMRLLKSRRPVFLSTCSLEQALTLQLIIPDTHIRLILPERVVNTVPRTFIAPRPGQTDEDYHWRLIHGAYTAVEIAQDILNDNPWPLVNSIQYLPQIEGEQAIRQVNRQVALDLLELMVQLRTADDRPINQFWEFLRNNRRQVVDLAKTDQYDTTIRPDRWIGDWLMTRTDWGGCYYALVSPIGTLP